MSRSVFYDARGCFSLFVFQSAATAYREGGIAATPLPQLPKSAKKTRIADKPSLPQVPAGDAAAGRSRHRDNFSFSRLRFFFPPMKNGRSLFRSRCQLPASPAGRYASTNPFSFTERQRIVCRSGVAGLMPGQKTRLDVSSLSRRCEADGCAKWPLYGNEVGRSVGR